MINEKYSRVSTNLKYKNPWWEYIVDEYILPNGQKGEYHYVKTPGSCFIIPLSDNNKFFMVRQFRYLNGKYSIEFPGGGMKEGISALDNAIIELHEEAGLISDDIKFIGEFNPYNGVTSEIRHVFLAKSLKETEANPEESEEIEIMQMSEKEINSKILNGEIWDGMTLSAWSLYFFSKQNGGF